MEEWINSWSDQILTEARSWIGTPFLHHTSRKSIGTDCLGFILGVRRNIGGGIVEMPPYSEKWYLFSKNEKLRDGISVHFPPAPEEEKLGDILAFRVRERGPICHLGILSQITPSPRFIHIFSDRHVVETSLSKAWSRRISARFVFPVPNKGDKK